MILNRHKKAPGHVLFDPNPKCRIMVKNTLMGLLLTLLLPACKVTYSTTGASIDPEVETISVQYFPNRAPIVTPTLSQKFTDALREKFRSQTRLNLVNGYGDVNFEGEIINYETNPIAIQADETASKNRLTVTVRVRYTNTVNPDADFDTNFSRYEDYDANRDLSSVENELLEDIIQNLTEDIFNKAFVNW
jgi:hypothetical protein